MMPFFSDALTFAHQHPVLAALAAVYLLLTAASVYLHVDAANATQRYMVLSLSQRILGYLLVVVYAILVTPLMIVRRVARVVR
jgi:hypothetical protein